MILLSVTVALVSADDSNRFDFSDDTTIRSLIRKIFKPNIDDCNISR
jgi:hypothetical protein